ncbi:MAG: ThiF family adenylyltransferase [Clostridia bacterium]|nr:ThiF family adenylyltransferase [Clostridia bacterium]
MTKEQTQGFSLGNFTCGIIGIGGLGCNIAIHLTGAGIGKLVICDYDKVSAGNLNRQFLYTPDDIGKSKVISAKMRLCTYSPDTKISAIETKITDSNIPDELKNCDMIFLAVDNKKARKTVASFCEENRIPLMMGGIDGFYGKAYLYIPGVSPTPEKAGMLDGKKAESNISATAGIIGSLQAAVGMQYLLARDNTLGGKLTVFDKDSFDTLKIL